MLYIVTLNVINAEDMNLEDGEINADKMKIPKC